MGPFYSDLARHRLFALYSVLYSDLEASAPADHLAAVDSVDLVYLIDSDPVDSFVGPADFGFDSVDLVYLIDSGLADLAVAASCSVVVDLDCFGYGQF